MASAVRARCRRGFSAASRRWSAALRGQSRGLFFAFGQQGGELLLAALAAAASPSAAASSPCAAAAARQRSRRLLRAAGDLLLQGGDVGRRGRGSPQRERRRQCTRRAKRAASRLCREPAHERPRLRWPSRTLRDARKAAIPIAARRRRRRSGSRACSGGAGSGRRSGSRLFRALSYISSLLPPRARGSGAPSATAATRAR